MSTIDLTKPIFPVGEDGISKSESSFVNSPLDFRTKVATLEDIKEKWFPYIGMIFYVENEKEYYVVTKLGPNYNRGKPVAGTENTRIYYNPETGGDLGCVTLKEFLGIGSGSGGGILELPVLVLEGDAEKDFNIIAGALGGNPGGFFKIKKNTGTNEYYYASVAKDMDPNLSDSIPDTHTEAYAISYWEGSYLSHTTSYRKKEITKQVETFIENESGDKVPVLDEENNPVTHEEIVYEYSKRDYNLGDINFTLSTIIDKLPLDLKHLRGFLFSSFYPLKTLYMKEKHKARFSICSPNNIMRDIQNSLI